MTTVKKVDGRSEKARLTRARILDAAGELFVRAGYGATSLQDIAERAGCAVQAAATSLLSNPGARADLTVERAARLETCGD